MKMKRKLEDFGTRSAAENRILRELGSGEDIILHDGLPPNVPDDAYDVRAEFIRYLALGGCEACSLHEKGLRVWGARLVEDLDLESGDVLWDLALINCRIEGKLILQSARIQNLFLNGSYLYEGIEADRLEVRRNVVLREMESLREVRLVGAKLGGNLECSKAKFNALGSEASARDDIAFNAARAEIHGDVIFRDAASFGELNVVGAKIAGSLIFDSALLSAWPHDGISEKMFALSADQVRVQGNVSLVNLTSFGQIRLLGAELGADLVCNRAKFHANEDDQQILNKVALWADGMETKGSVFFRQMEATGAVFFLGVRLRGSLECDGAVFTPAVVTQSEQLEHVLSLEGSKVDGFFFLRYGVEINGLVSLAGATVGGLIDSPESWPKSKKSMLLDRFSYTAFLGASPINAKVRLEWLDKVDHDHGFSPQPYEQLAKVLREMGHREDARVVLIEKERLQRAASKPPFWRRVWNRVMRESAGYGYRPSLSLRYLAGLMVIGMLVFGAADLMGAVKPNSARVWHLPEWEQCEDNPISPKWCYLLSEKGESYPAFNPFIYSIDTLLPIVDLEMQGAWIPDDRASWWGISARFYLWAHIALGWFFSLLAVAGFSGLIKPE